VALAFCLRRPEVAAVITGATRVAQLEENAAASGLELGPALVRRLERLFPV
jgi:aryl-alcohol dehydrogenase-like predicted oxidoreductase